MAMATHNVLTTPRVLRFAGSSGEIQSHGSTSANRAREKGRREGMDRTRAVYRMSPAHKERLIERCLHRMQTERRRIVQASRSRLRGDDDETAYAIRDLLNTEAHCMHVEMGISNEEPLREALMEQDMDHAVLEGQESGCTYRSGDGDDEEELAVLLGEKYGDFLLWIEDRLRAELAAQEEELFEYMVTGKFEVEDITAKGEQMEKLHIPSQEEYLLCPVCKEASLQRMEHTFGCICGLAVQTNDTSFEELRATFNSVILSHRSSCSCELTFQQHKGALHVYCWECAYFETLF